MVEDSRCTTRNINKKTTDPRVRCQFHVSLGQEAHYASHAKNMRNHVQGVEQRFKNQCPPKPMIELRGSGNLTQLKSKTVQQTATMEKCYRADENSGINSRRCFQSKIPVLKGRSMLPSLKNKNSQNAALDSSLSAADRRQKFHQSRLRAGCPDFHHAPAQDAKRCRILPALPVQVSHPPGSGVDPKANFHVLPKIPQSDICNGVPTNTKGAENQNGQAVVKSDIPDAGVQENKIVINGKKKKGLLGEFTHFPALCNNTHKKPSKNTYVSTVPHLPPILPPPAPPPPSVSASLEQEVK